MTTDTTNPLVLNIPHSRWEFPEPYYSQLIVPEWEWIYETLVLTDWFTDELFNISGSHRIVAPVSRLLVDTERLLPDKKEPMAQLGMGCLYTHGSRGQRLRPELGPEARQELLDKYYYPHHTTLASTIGRCLDNHGGCLFVDCHSFPDKPFPFEPQNLRRPDICLGTHSHNTPPELLEMLKNAFSEAGYSVEVDSPYAGCALPHEHNGDKRVLAIMIEVNRKLYIDQQDPVYSETVVDQANLPVRNEHTHEIKRVLWNTLLNALWTFVKPKSELPQKTSTRPPEDQRQLSSFMHQLNEGELSPEMKRWWWNRY